MILKEILENNFPLGELTKEITRIEAFKHSLKTPKSPKVKTFVC